MDGTSEFFMKFKTLKCSTATDRVIRNAVFFLLYAIQVRGISLLAF